MKPPKPSTQIPLPLPGVKVEPPPPRPIHEGYSRRKKRVLASERSW